ncbi:MAG: hypothetical protein Q8S13_09300 [Dehalococcoidia bacterium]|nr:hypothetical protein [Dehalococcoidia bacterium]
MTFADLNAEFDNLINGALTMISPLTASLDAGSFDITALDELAFTDAAANASAAGRLRRNATALHWHDGTASRGIVLNSADFTANRMVYATGARVLLELAAMTNGQLVVGSSGAAPVVAAITAGANITITPGAGSITIAQSTGGTDITVPDGGTGVSTLAANGVLYGQGASPVLVTAQGGAFSILTANSGAPSFSATPRIGTSLGVGAAVVSDSVLLVAGHIHSTSTTPTVGTCGTSPSLTSGTDVAGTVLTGSTGVTQCTLTFGTAWATAPECVVASDGNISPTVTSVNSISTTTLVAVFSGSITAGSWHYICIGKG